MDKKIEGANKKGRRRLYWIIIFAVTFSIFSAWSFTRSGNSYKLEKGRAKIAQVEKGIFDDVIPIQGNVEPVRSFFLDAIEGGTVQEVYVEAGTQVKKGDSLLKLTNTNLMLDFMNRETQIVEQINNLRNTRIQMELNERNIKEQVLDIEQELQRMERQFVIDTTLYSSEAISRQQYEDSQSRYKYLKRKKKLLSDSYNKDALYRQLQVKRIDQSIELMERNLKAITNNLNNLTVRAPISGQLTSFDAEIGESKNRGENLGRIDVMDGFKMSANIDEHYLGRVKVGQIGKFPMGGTRYEVEVVKVFPEVNNNQFEVELRFIDSIPNGIRRGQSINIRLALSNSSEARLVQRGGFYSNTGGKWVYVLDESEGKAYKREIKLGRQNPDYFEVKEGLDVGEKVIISGYDAFSEYEIIQLQ
jgi:HlyD family secretion protein